MHQMDTCLTCGGAIFQPGVAVQYAGKICQCIVPPKIQKPAREIASEDETLFLQRLLNEKTDQLEYMSSLHKAHFKKFEEKIKQLEDQVSALQKENARLRKRPEYTKKMELEAEINGHMDALRPLLREWAAL